MYAVDYLTGEAVFNFDQTNDDEANDNTRAGSTGTAGSTGGLLRRSDRHLVLGGGIPSGAVVVVSEDGTSDVVVGCGGGICKGETNPGGTTIPIYWMTE